MNLKKFFAAAAVLIFSTGLSFAQDLDEKTLEYTQKAITQSLMIFDAHKDANNLTDTDRAIETALNTTLPAIFNQIENPSDELGAELETAINGLSDILVTYQQLYPANMLDKDAANFITFNIALTYAAQNQLISQETAQIIAAGLMEAMFGEEE